MLPVKVESKPLYDTSAQQSLVRSSFDTCASSTSRGIAARMSKSWSAVFETYQSRSYACFTFFPAILEGKREDCVYFCLSANTVCASRLVWSRAQKRMGGEIRQLGS